MHKKGYLYGKIRLCYNKEVTTGNRGNGRSMTIFDTLAERHIQAALESGELQGLAGEGKPLTLDDDSHVPPELRVGYRLLKNAGYLPPALLARQEAVSLAELLSALPPDSAEYEQTNKRLRLLALQMQQAGLNTDFLYHRYHDTIQQALNKNK
ncbi:DUF1992 domain-containing protein [Morganella morganii]|nr:DUF1992 domain-containing protein [Morganella morganii]ELW9225101.1 DUF1992 domain-containing protein [Morganella morganii]